MFKQIRFELSKPADERYFKGFCWNNQSMGFYGCGCALIKAIVFGIGGTFASFETIMEVLSSHLYVTKSGWFEWEQGPEIAAEGSSWSQHIPEIMAQLSYLYLHPNLVNTFTIIAFGSTILVILIELCMAKMATPDMAKCML